MRLPDRPEDALGILDEARVVVVEAHAAVASYCAERVDPRSGSVRSGAHSSEWPNARTGSPPPEWRQRSRTSGGRSQGGSHRGNHHPRISGYATDLAGAAFDQKSQYDQVVPWLLGGEKLYAVFDCKGGGTGFIAVTNKRLLFYDKAFLGKRKALTSVPVQQDHGGLERRRRTGPLRGDEPAGLEDRVGVLRLRVRGGDKAQKAYEFIMYEMLQNEPT